MDPGRLEEGFEIVVYYLLSHHTIKKFHHLWTTMSMID
jgi:hypothetical protein